MINTKLIVGKESCQLPQSLIMELLQPLCIAQIDSNRKITGLLV